MARIKIDYGIDLGTTNSAIARMENGEVKIIKSDTQKDTTPSCVYFRKNTILVGDTAYGRYGDEQGRIQRADHQGESADLAARA